MDKVDGEVAVVVGERVQLLRRGRGWSQVALAKRAGVSQATVANFERGRTRGGLALTLAKLAKALNVNPEWLRTGKGDANPPLDATSEDRELVAIYRQLSPQNRKALLSVGRSLIASQEP